MHVLHETEPTHASHASDAGSSDQGLPPMSGQHTSLASTLHKQHNEQIRDLSPDIPAVCHWLLVNTWANINELDTRIAAFWTSFPYPPQMQSPRTRDDTSYTGECWASGSVLHLSTSQS